MSQFSGVFRGGGGVGHAPPLAFLCMITSGQQKFGPLYEILNTPLSQFTYCNTKYKLTSAIHAILTNYPQPSLSAQEKKPHVYHSY